MWRGVSLPRRRILRLARPWVRRAVKENAYAYAYDDDDDDDDSTVTSSSSSSSNNNELKIFGRAERHGGRREQVTSADARCIINHLQVNPHIATLNIKYCTLHDPDALTILRDGLLSCPHVKTVILEDVALQNEGLEILRPAFYNTSVTSLSLSWNLFGGDECGGESLRLLLEGNENLKEFDLSHNRGLGNAGAFGLGRGLARNSYLEKLNLFWCYMENEGLESLLAGVNHNDHNSEEEEEETIIINTTSALMDIDLSFNNISGAAGGRLVRRFLQCFSKSLLIFCVACNELGKEGVRAIARPADVNNDTTFQTKITNLCLTGSDFIGSDLAVFILPMFPALQDLECSTNPLGPEGLQALAAGLPRHVQRLRLSSCIHNNLNDMEDLDSTTKVSGQEGKTKSQGSSSLESITNILLRCKSLVKLDISCNEALFEGRPQKEIRGLSQAVSNHKCLREIYMGGIDMHDDTEKEMMRGIAASTSLRVVNDCMGDQGFSPENRRRVDLLLERKVILEHVQTLSTASRATLLQALVKADSHEHEMSVMFEILLSRNETILFGP